MKAKQTALASHLDSDVAETGRLQHNDQAQATSTVPKSKKGDLQATFRRKNTTQTAFMDSNQTSNAFYRRQISQMGKQQSNNFSENCAEKEPASAIFSSRRQMNKLSQSPAPVNKHRQRTIVV
mmetsp:Transcript_18790/g.25489  ORF Transcript_18790/g.25489 Transcript_18790/m.25489 type:complete len:123 (+) Transcript_18790:1886-2254(+)|eukprot:CAMPEP_0185607012 /NCGR_PEP_ID=MMETSP0436-20130131/5215_1 /TAXON_ID=626734 ORGANISM="Favella taraikaensis, Strain Fe Narragansett Bay" /NCGR_SAMPLE_ID=MMETSP0436 /ASSEMBLY_ACC=CAM_ASM_000390 /LENGTH=122 /DNA_ID=CAMNT_0028238805 /DNA_START=396 /DNA_END=764 /DNA_ORIENTATION=-